MEHSPIFVAGISRCGKTMIRSFLDSHPHIAISGIGAWPYFYGRFGDLSRRDNFEHCLREMLSDRPQRFLKLNPERIRRSFWQGEPSYARLFQLFQEEYARCAGKSRWGDAAELMERYADLIFAAYPTAKMIHMVRDPRDRYAASMDRWQGGRGGAGGAVAVWLYSIRLAQRNQARYPDRYKVVRYETLVTRPQETLRELCQFLGEEYGPGIAVAGGGQGFRRRYQPEQPDGDAETSFITARYVGCFSERLHAYDIAFIQDCARRSMAAYGYDPAPIRFSPHERLVYAMIRWPANLARLLLWYGTALSAPGRLIRTAGRFRQNMHTAQSSSARM